MARGSALKRITDSITEIRENPEVREERRSDELQAYSIRLCD